MLPEPTMAAQEGDVVWVVVPADQVDDYDRTSARRAGRRALMRVLIVGGGKVGTFIASELGAGRSRRASSSSRARRATPRSRSPA